jgi:hypothetical protein
MGWRELFSFLLSTLLHMRRSQSGSERNFRAEPRSADVERTADIAGDSFPVLRLDLGGRPDMQKTLQNRANDPFETSVSVHAV